MRRITSKTKRKGPRETPQEVMTEGPMRRYRKPRRFFQKMSNSELIHFARAFIRENSIQGSRALTIAFPQLYENLRKRKLVSQAGVRHKTIRYAELGEKELVEYAKRFMVKRKITERTQLRRASQGLFCALQNRCLLGSIGLVVRRIEWSTLTDQEIISKAKELIEMHGIKTKSEMQKNCGGLYCILKKKNLINTIRFEKRKQEERIWDSMPDQSLLGYAKCFARENHIRYSNALKRADRGLYEILRKRGLLLSVGLEKMKTNWKAMSDMDVVEYAKRVLECDSIKMRSGLFEMHQMLYIVLRKRKLLDLAFFEIECARKQETESRTLAGLSQAALAMEKFGGEVE